MEGKQNHTIGNSHQARSQSSIAQLAASFTSQPVKEQALAVVRQELRQQSSYYRGLQPIPLDSIAGNIGRYREFSRHFLPLVPNLAGRWANAGWPVMEADAVPIDAYLAGGVYFVHDGNYRTCAARYQGLSTIEAHVWDYPLRVHIHSHETLDDVLIRLGKQDFLAKTSLDESMADYSIRFTTPGRYSELLAQIRDLQQQMEKVGVTAVPFTTAAAAWYEMIYRPTSQAIRTSSLLEEFPGHTESDFYVWLSLHCQQLEKIYGSYENWAELVRILADHDKAGSIEKVMHQAISLVGAC